MLSHQWAIKGRRRRRALFCCPLLCGTTLGERIRASTRQLRRRGPEKEEEEERQGPLPRRLRLQ
jgi:hypothetical protein